MGMNIECMLYLQSKNILSKDKNKVLDIGPQNVYNCTVDQIKEFVLNQGGDVSSSHFNDEAVRLEYFSTPRPDERTTLFSEITDLTNIEYKAFDVCPAFKTQLLDLNFDPLPAEDYERFDVVLNFGTTEHVFNQWNSFSIMHDALKVGGVLYCVLPASGYLDHGYYCYTPLFFRDLANANGYEILDMFFAQAGENSLKGIQADIRKESMFQSSNSANLAPQDDRVPCFNIHVVVKKSRSGVFKCGLEVATAHSSASEAMIARYDNPELISARAPDLTGLAAICRRLEEEKEARIVERDRFHTERDEIERKLMQVYTSNSWRITAPLRFLASFLRSS
ncbi:hypothetical protein [Methylomonas sp. YC3]